MMPERLEPEKCYVFVFGPGFGESTVLRIPPDHWVVIDSCHAGGHAAALHVLGRYEGRCSCVVLTHPHRDHYPGLSDVLHHADWPLIGCCDLRLDDADDLESSDDPEERRQGELEQILATIRHAWGAAPDCTWWTWRGKARQIGEARLTALHPEETVARARRETNPNNLSSAILVEWRGTRLLLGADVENPHWDEICNHPRDENRDGRDQLSEHALMKVPHHASAGALCEGILGGRGERFWIVTPYNKGKGLPRFDDDQGAHLLLQHQATIHLTGLPVAHDRQMQCPCEATRRELALRAKPGKHSFALPGGRTLPIDPVRNALACYIVAAFDDSGRGEIISYGPGTIRLTEGL